VTSASSVEPYAGERLTARGILFQIQILVLFRKIRKRIKKRKRNDPHLIPSPPTTRGGGRGTITSART
jgi:hypothetical protein